MTKIKEIALLLPARPNVFKRFLTRTLTYYELSCICLCKRLSICSTHVCAPAVCFLVFLFPFYNFCWSVCYSCIWISMSACVRIGEPAWRDTCTCPPPVPMHRHAHISVPQHIPNTVFIAYQKI